MVNQLKFYRDVVSRICSSLHIEAAMFRVLPCLAEYIPVDEMYVSIYNYNQDEYRVIAKADTDGGILLNQSIPMSPEAITLIRYLDENHPCIIDDWKKDAVVRDIFNTPSYPSGPCMLIPLTIENHMAGVLFLLNWEKIPYTQEHAKLLLSVSQPFCIALQNALRYQNLKNLKQQSDEENAYLKKERERGCTVIGKDNGLKEVYDAVKRVAPLNSTVLLLGETGTGKEVIAREIHRLSEREKHLMVCVNCGAIPETLLDSELFGYEKGAFTGANAQKSGYFERANGGSIFLDEIGELTADAQVRLLRVIEQRQIERVGGVKSIPINTRIICATNRDLTEMVEKGTFRRDLYFRISVFPITIPPLRERKEDIPSLVEYFLRQKSKELGIRQVPRCSSTDMALLMEYGWPGNVRELQNLIERALILSGNDNVCFAPLLANCQPSAGAGQTGLDSMNESMAKHIKKALKQSGGRIEGRGGAAELLDIHPNTLRNRMKKLDIHAGDYKAYHKAFGDF